MPSTLQWCLGTSVPMRFHQWASCSLCFCDLYFEWWESTYCACQEGRRNETHITEEKWNPYYSILPLVENRMRIGVQMMVPPILQWFFKKISQGDTYPTGCFRNQRDQKRVYIYYANYDLPKNDPHHVCKAVNGGQPSWISHMSNF